MMKRQEGVSCMGRSIGVANIFRRLLIIIQYPQMTNPFAAFDISDDEEDNKLTVVKTEEKVRRTHQDKKNYKKQQEESLKNVVAPAPAPVAEPLPEKTKERKAYPHMEREKKDWKQKEVTSGHTHDRRSGTGREDRPRKAGGGYGNVGNIKDEQNADKYVKETAEETNPEETKVEAEVPAVEVKPASPQKLTLDEYYKSKGVDLAFNVAAKGPAKKGEINADWLKKEKLQVLQTKEDKRQQEKGNTEQSIKFSTTKVGLDLDEDKLNIVGFGTKAASKHEHKHGEKHDHKHFDNKGKKGKLQFSADDFPTL